jgi:hypothetical protein
MREWQSAIDESSNVIDNNSLYRVVSSLDSVFLINNPEAIFQINSPYSNPWETSTYIFSGTPVNAILSNSIMEAFEKNDLRRDIWVDSTIDVDNNVYYYPTKYKAIDLPVIEYTTVMRLSEQFLIRAEANTRLNNIPNAIADLDVIRERAGLPLISSIDPGISQSELIEVILHERQVELFTEWGHRWFDLKRSELIDVVIGDFKSNWNFTDALFPIPEIQIQNDPAMKNDQNEGY